jgi:hypothetical protein
VPLSQAQRAVIALLVLLVMWCAWQSRLSSQHQQQYENNSSGTNKPNPEPPKVSTDGRIANYTLSLAILTGVLAASTIGLWVVTWRSGVRQSKDMKNAVAAAHDANEISHRGIVADQRAWVLIGDLRIENGLDFKNNMAGMYITVKVSNVGKTPALNVRTKMEMIYGYETVPDAVKSMSEECRNETRIHSTRTLLPGDSYRQKRGFIIEAEPSADIIFPVIIGCTTYQISLDKSVHQTAFVFHLFECQAGKPSEAVDGISPRKGLLPQNRVGWDGGSGSFAD